MRQPSRRPTVSLPGLGTLTKTLGMRRLRRSSRRSVRPTRCSPTLRSDANTTLSVPWAAVLVSLLVPVDLLPVADLKTCSLACLVGLLAVGHAAAVWTTFCPVCLAVLVG